MPWPIPQPAAIYARAAAQYQSVYPDFQPQQPNTLSGVAAKIIAMTAFDLYGHQGYLAQELFPDTAQDNLDRHAATWGLTRLPPAAASGPATATAGAASVPIAAGTVATDPLGNSFFVTQAITVPASASATVTVQAATAGAQGDLVAGTVLTLLSPIAGLAAQQFVVAGDATVSGAVGTAVPAAIGMLDAAGNAYTSGAAVTLAATSGTIAFTASAPQSAGSLVAGAVLTFTSTVSGLSPQSATVTVPGLTGGAPAESNDALRSRVLARIRARGRGGNGTDYQQWSKAASSSVAAVQVGPCWAGAGNVAVWLAGNGPSAVSATVVSDVTAALGPLAPVVATLIVASAATQPINATIHLIEDTTTNRTAATAAFGAWTQEAALAAFDTVLARGVTTGGTLYVEDLATAIGSAGPFKFDLTAPGADIVLTAGTVGVPGTLSFA